MADCERCDILTRILNLYDQKLGSERAYWAQIEQLTAKAIALQETDDASPADGPSPPSEG